jgi:nuclear pore complex protein Nup98-Nup96
MARQLDRWTEVRADARIHPDRMALYSLVAGRPVWEGTGPPINTCSGLDWRRALAAHLWYLTHPLASVGDALHQFAEAWGGEGPYGQYCAPPRPAHSGTEAGPSDLCYQLVRLYTDRSAGLEVLLAPASHTPDPLDYRLSWFLHRVLTVLGYRHLAAGARDRLHRDTASQAERLGLWHWAVFVLCHLEEPARRRQAVEAMLERNVQSLDAAREEFLVGELGVPGEWVARARATLARAEGRPQERAEWLLAARRWQEAHTVIVKEIAPEAIIGQEYGYLHRLLGQLAPGHISEHIPGWGSQGQVPPSLTHSLPHSLTPSLTPSVLRFTTSSSAWSAVWRGCWPRGTRRACSTSWSSCGPGCRPCAAPWPPCRWPRPGSASRRARSPRRWRT